MTDLPAPPIPPDARPGWCLSLYPRLSPRARRRLAAMLVVAALAGHALAAGGNVRSPIARPAWAGAARDDGAAAVRTDPMVAHALRALGLDAPPGSDAPAAMDNTPAGSQFQVNTVTTSNQEFPAVAMDADGDFVVVWQSNASGGTDSSDYSIQGQRFNAAGTAVGSQFQVNTYTTGTQFHPSVAIDADGDFVVVWQSYGSPGNDSIDSSVQGQRFNAAGTAVGGQFQVNTFTTDVQSYPSVAIDADGDFVVVWQSIGSVGGDGSSTSVQGQRYNAAGTAQGGQFQVNSFGVSSQSQPSAAMDADGDFVVVWQSYGSSGADTNGDSVQGQRFNAAGTAQGGQFEINTFTASNQNYPSVAVDTDGDFVVVWQSYGASGGDTSLDSIHGRRYDAAGTALGSQFQINTYTTNRQEQPSVARDADGDFAVTWRSLGASGDTAGFSVQGRSYTAAGAAASSQFQVNTYTTDNQGQPAVAMDADGDFVVAWNSGASADSDTSGPSIQAQRYVSSNPSGGSTATPTDGPSPTPTTTPTDGPTPTGTPMTQPPTAVQLRHFRAIGLADQAIVVWETVGEVDTLGFNVLRAPAAAGPWRPVNPSLIPAEGGAGTGRAYALRDAPGPGVWHFRLEDIGTADKRTLHPAISVRVGPGAEGTELFLPRATSAGAAER